MLAKQPQPFKGFKQSLVRNLLQQLEEKDNNQRERQKLNPFTKYTNPQLLKDTVKLSKVWKGAGVVNKQFGAINPLKNRVLSQWQIQRMPLAKRSYSSPKDFKGLKYDPHSREFAIKNSKQMYSNEFNRYLQTIQQKYEENLFRPNATELQKLKDKKKEMNMSKLKFTTSSSFFGIPKQDSKMGTLKSFKSEIFKRSNKFE